MMQRGLHDIWRAQHPDAKEFTGPSRMGFKAARSFNPQDFELSSCDPMEHGEDSSHSQAPEGDAIAPCHNLSSWTPGGRVPERVME